MTDPKISNLLPEGGIVNYYGKLIPDELADSYFERLFHSIDWKNDEAFIFGKHFITKRKVAWYGDEPYPYSYSNSTKTALPWTPELLELKQLIEAKSHENFNSCLLNLYHDGDEGMAQRRREGPGQTWRHCVIQPRRSAQVWLQTQTQQGKHFSPP